MASWLFFARWLLRQLEGLPAFQTVPFPRGVIRPQNGQILCANVPGRCIPARGRDFTKNIPATWRTLSCNPINRSK